MKFSTTALSVATLSLAILTPLLGQAQAPESNNSAGLTEAQQMVPARASLPHKLDANDAHPGSQFRATLSDNVHLSNGVVLHHGDTLLGTVANDDTNLPGKSRLAVRFTQVLLKNGQTIPIKATIVAIYSPDQLESQNGSDIGEQVPNTWNDGTLKVDDINALNNVDLHSRIGSSNSGVFVSTKNSDVKIPAGSEIALAIAAQPNAATSGE